MSLHSKTPRRGTATRESAETRITVEVELDAVDGGVQRVKTGLPFFDHLLSAFARHGRFGLVVDAKGDLEIDAHHTVEDTGIVLGEAIREALGTKEGITRYGHAYLPMDETLSRVVIDLSNRPYLEFRAPANTPSAPNLPFSLVEEFCRALANNLRANIHVEVFYGRDGHHVAESIFKGLARALRQAATRDPRVLGIPSTKEAL